MSAVISDEFIHQVSTAIARLYPGLGCRCSKQSLSYRHPTEPSTLSVSADDEGHFHILLEYAEPFAITVSSSASNLSHLLDVVRNWREEH
jgi:hypothetical protein